MFLASFALFTLVFTSFLRFKRGLVFFILFFSISVLLVLVSHFLKRGKSTFFQKSKKLIFAQGGAFLLASLTIFVSLFFYDQKLGSDFFSFAPLSLDERSHPTGFEPFLQQVLVLEQTKPDTSLIQTSEGRSYLLKSQTPHQPWTSLYLGASLKPLDVSKLYAEFAFQTGFAFQEIFHYQFNYDKWLLMKGIHGTCYEKFSLPGSAPSLHPSWLQKQLLTTRSRLQQQVHSALPGEQGALLLGMLIGDKSQLPTGEYQNFIASGIVHIIAVSWGNLVMIVIFLGAVLFRVPFYLRNGLIILGVVAFALLCGGDSSVVRALIMAVLSLFALFRGREIQIWRLLKYAFILMLCYNPFFLIYDLGFLLSFWAVIGIVLVSEMLSKFQEKRSSSSPLKKKKIRLPFLSSFLKNYGLPTLGATLWTLPILLFFIGETNLAGVVINLIVVPFVPIITIGGFLSVLFVAWTGRGWLMFPLKWLLKMVFLLSKLAIQWSFAITISEVRAKRSFIVLILGIGVVGYRLSKRKEGEEEKSK